jgi:hypothetical protein
MGVFKQWFGIDCAVSRVEPRLKQFGSYPDDYRKPVLAALQYARGLARSVPGPIKVNVDSYARDVYVHAIFPSVDFVADAFRSSWAMQSYLSEHSSADSVYALMGMRRCEKTTMGMELLGQVVQHDVPQRVVYFTNHSIENPAPSEKLAREQIAWSFFDSLVGQVAKRVALHKLELQSQRQEKDLLMARMHSADSEARPAMEEELSSLLSSMQSTSRTLDLQHYLDDFEAVLLSPAQYLHLDQAPMVLDSMGIRRESDATLRGKQIVFNDLIGFDRRDWTVILVHADHLQSVNFSTRLETAYRRLAL